MHKIGKLGLQVFAAPDNMTGQAQIQVKAREIDFVTSFGKNIQALLDVLGIEMCLERSCCCSTCVLYKHWSLNFHESFSA